MSKTKQILFCHLSDFEKEKRLQLEKQKVDKAIENFRASGSKKCYIQLPRDMDNMNDRRHYYDRLNEHLFKSFPPYKVYSLGGYGSTMEDEIDSFWIPCDVMDTCYSWQGKFKVDFSTKVEVDQILDPFPTTH